MTSPVHVLRLTFFVCLILSGGGVRAMEPLQLVGTVFPLVIEHDKGDNVVGLAIDVLDKIASDENIPYEVTLYPFPRLMHMVRNHQSDGAVGLYQSSERRQYLRYTTHAFYDDSLVVATLRDHLSGWNGSLSSLKGQKLLFISSWAYGAEMERHRASLSLQPIGTVSQGLNMVLADRAQGVLVNQRSVEVFRQKNPAGQELELLMPPFGHHKGYFTLDRHRVDQRLFDRFDAALSRLVESGFVAERNRFYGLDYQPVQ